MTISKNTKFRANHADILAILPYQEFVILTKFHIDKAKFEDFLLIANL